jgi:tRNA nucleotidyltransferase/poly(A) polymerase
VKEDNVLKLELENSFLEFLKGMLQEMAEDCELYLVGGAVRDVLGGLGELKDLDLMIANATEAQVDLWLGTLQKKRVIYFFQQVGKSFPVYKLKLPEVDGLLDLALARTERSTGFGHRDFEVHAEKVTAREDGERRDFTVNALFCRFFLEQDKVNWELVDYFHGVEHLKERILVCVGNALARMEEDPLRILRALRFVHQKGFKLNEELKEVIKKHSSRLLPALSEDRIQDEFLKTMQANCKNAHKDYLSFSLYSVCFPEMIELFPAKLLDWLPDKIEHRELVFPVLLLDWYVRNDFSPEKSVWNSFDRALQTYRVPNPKAVKQVLTQLGDLVKRFETEVPVALQEKILSGPHGELILWMYENFEHHFQWHALHSLEHPPKRLTGKDVMQWGVKPGPGFEMLLLRIREAQWNGESEPEKLKTICL